MKWQHYLVFVGNILYHFDRALFGLLAPFLAPLFFPQMDPIYALISVYAIGPLTLFAKPLGALVFGYFGDRIGRARILSITLIGMSIKTALMGFLPTYEQIGVFAPIFLTLTRVAIGFFSAGETTGGAIFLLEQTENKKRNLLSSLFDASGILGIFIASFSIFAMSSYPQFWRILFWSGGLIGLVGWSFRKFPDEHPIMPRIQKSCWRILWQQRQAVFAVASIAGFSSANYYLITNFMNGFLPMISSITKEQTMGLNSFLLGMDFFLLPVFGMLNLKVRRETLMCVAILGIMLFSIPLFLLLIEPTLLKAACVRIGLIIFGVCLAAPYHAWKYDRTPIDHRYLIGAFGTALGNKFFGSPIPAIGLWLYHKTGLVIAPVFPVILLGIFPLVYLLKPAFEKSKLPQKI